MASLMARLRLAWAVFRNPQPIVEMDKGEWRCKCPASTTYDTSINPSYIKMCAKCGAHRPVGEPEEEHTWNCQCVPCQNRQAQCSACESRYSLRLPSCPWCARHSRQKMEQFILSIIRRELHRETTRSGSIVRMDMGRVRERATAILHDLFPGDTVTFRTEDTTVFVKLGQREEVPIRF